MHTGASVLGDDLTPQRRPGSIWRWTRRLVLLFAAVVIGWHAWVFWQVWRLRDENPNRTAFMEQGLARLHERNPQARLKHRWTRYEQISVHLKRAVLAAEDQKFLAHQGFDWDEVEKAYERNQQSQRVVRGASTISQQLAKNLFLTQQRSYWRKTEEAIITLMIESTLPKRRILEPAHRTPGDRSARQPARRGRVVRDAKTVFANAAAARMYGFSSSRELIGTEALDLAPEKEAERMREYHRRRVAGEKAPIEYESTARRRDGAEIPIEVTATRFYYDGQAASLLVARDLSTEKRLKLYEQILPVCCVCGKIRDDSSKPRGQGEWGRLDHYVMRHSDAQLSHTFCPECLVQYRREQGLT